ncbi:MAG: hypothetical protein NXI18_18530 [Alphaproteobacteria bacterium]|nr:hypothetical protein [Alphaproteobacteria bacterium]
MSAGKHDAIMLLHRTGNLARSLLAPSRRGELDEEVRQAVVAIGRLEDPRNISLPDLTDPNALVHAAIAAGVSIADLEEAVRLARYQLNQERIAG